MKKYLLAAAMLSFFVKGIAQEVTEITPYTDSRTITTGVPFLLIASDARAAGMGDQGVATSPDAYSQQWNLSKYAFGESEQGVSLTYTPYLSQLVNDIFLGGITYYKKLDDRSAISASFRYFSLGEIEFRQTGDPLEQSIIEKPNELTFDVGYSLKLSDNFAMGVALRYLRSDLKLQNSGQNIEANAANSFAVDVTGYYESEEKAYSSFNGKWRGGFAIQNFGPKIKYDDAGQENFLPTTLRLGGGFDFVLDEANTIGVTVEAAKLLVPTPPVRGLKRTYIDDGDNGTSAVQPGNGVYDENFDTLVEEDTNYIIEGQDNDVNFLSGMFQSFGDAPGGMSEELKEFTYAIGAEYVYQENFAFRLGYFNENETKGARKFFSLGAGFKYNVINIDVSYLFSASKVPSPLENTLRFSLGFNF